MKNSTQLHTIQLHTNTFVPSDSKLVSGSFWNWICAQQKFATSLIAILLCVFPALAQLPGLTYTEATSEVQYLDKNREVQASAAGAWFTRTNEVDLEMIYHVEVVELVSGELVMTGSYSDASLTTEEGLFNYYFTDGSQESQGNFKAGVKRGDWKRWDWKGVPKADRFYSSYAYNE